MSLETEIYRKSLGLDSGAGLRYSQETEDLLQAALQQGGSVAQIAAEIAHPNAGFISMARHKLGQAFSFTMDTLMLPSNAVAALMDSDLTYAEARKNKITPADIIFKDQERAETFTGRAGQFTARLITDVLLDPLTYVTFGTSSGLVGISKLSQIPLKGATAKKLGLATTKIVDETGKVIEETVRHRAVSKEGLAEMQKITNRIEDNIRRDTIDSFYSDTNIIGRFNRVADNVSKLDETGAKSLLDDLSARGHIGEFIVAEKVSKIAKNLTPDQFRAAKQVAIKEAMDEQAERLVRHTLNAKRADIRDQAAKRLSDIIERNVKSGGVIYDKFGKPLKDQFGNLMLRDLAEAFVDAGGIKAFGYSLVAGAKIRMVMGLIPGLSYIDRITQAPRSMLASIVSTKWTTSGRVPDTLIQLRQRAKDLQDVKQTAIFSFLPKLYQKLGITEEEDKILSAAIGSDIPPAASEDGRLETLWTLLRSEQGNRVAQEIAEGKHGDDIARMWKAANAIKEQLKRNLITMHESGIAAFPQKNYIPGVLEEQRKLINPFAKFKTSKAANAEKAELVKWRNVEDPSEVIYGTEDSLQLQKINKAEERLRIEKEIQRAVLENTEKRTKIRGEIEKLWDSVSEKQVMAIMRGSKEVLKGATKDTFNYEALERVIRQAVPKVDRDRILKQYVETYYEDGKKLTTVEFLTPEQIMDLKEELALGDEELDSIGRFVIDNLDNFGVKVTKAPSPGGQVKESKDAYQQALKKLQGIVMESGIKGKQRYLKEALDDTNFSKVIEGLSEEWHSDPGAIGRTMEAILGREFTLAQLMEDLSDVKRALEDELSGPGLKKAAGRWFYNDKQGKIYERLRATAKEINDNYFDGEKMFTESALKATLIGSLNALRASASRELIDDVARRFGVPQSAAPSDFVQLGIAGLQKEAIDLQKFLKLEDGRFAIKNAEGEELFFHPTVAEDVNNMMKVLSEDPGSELLARSYDRLTNMWKASVTSIWPAFHGRNAISNVFQHMMDIGFESLNPTNHIMASRLIEYNRQLENLALKMSEGDASATREMLELSSQEIMTDAKGYKWTIGELITVARNNVVAFNPNVVGQIDVINSSRQVVEFLMDDTFPKLGKYGSAAKKAANPFSQQWTPFRAGRAVGNYIEWQSRMVDFLANLRKTGDVEHAAMQTKQFLFDYQNLTPFERNFMRRIIPFYTWTRKNIELQVDTLLTKPGRVDMFAHGIDTVGSVWGMGPLADEEREALPEWMRSSLNLVVGRENDKIKLITTLGTPFEQPFQAFGNLMGSINPIIKGPIEAQTNFSFFHGRPISEITNATAFSGDYVPAFIKDFVGYTEVNYKDKTGAEHTLHVSLRPDNMFLFNNLPLTPRTISTLKMLETEDIDGQKKLLQGLLGFKADTVDIQAEGLKREKELRKQIEKLLDEAGVGYTFTRFQLNK